VRQQRQRTAAGRRGGSRADSGGWRRTWPWPRPARRRGHVPIDRTRPRLGWARRPRGADPPHRSGDDLGGNVRDLPDREGFAASTSATRRPATHTRSGRGARLITVRSRRSAGRPSPTTGASRRPTSIRPPRGRSEPRRRERGRRTGGGSVGIGARRRRRASGRTDDEDRRARREPSATPRHARRDGPPPRAAVRRHAAGASKARRGSSSRTPGSARTGSCSSASA
jgi:hypothetical protein